MFKLNWLGGGRTPKIKPNAKAKVVDVVDEIAFEKKVGILHIMCTIASTLMVAIILSADHWSDLCPSQRYVCCSDCGSCL